MRPIAKPELVPKGLKLAHLVTNRHQMSIYLSSTRSARIVSRVRPPLQEGA
jgi:hypothetical protein